MNKNTLLCLCGIALIIGAVLRYVGQVIEILLQDLITVTGIVWALYQACDFAGDLLIVMGFTAGLWVLLKPSWLGLAGYLLLVTGGTLYAFEALYALAVVPWIAQADQTLLQTAGPPLLNAIDSVGFYAFSVGGVLTGVSLYLSGLRAAGVFIAAGLALIGVLYVGVTSGVLSFLSGDLSTLAFLVLTIYSIGVVILGVTLIKLPIKSQHKPTKQINVIDPPIGVEKF